MTSKPKPLTVSQALREWKAKRRRMGCVAGTRWFCKRVPGFHPERLRRYTPEGEVFEHVVATDSTIRIDLTPYADRPNDDL